MPNIAVVLKDEITRLTRKELRLQVDPMRKQLVAQRKTISALKQEVDGLRRELSKLGKGASKRAAVAADPGQDGVKARYSADGLRKLRERLGLSREAFAPLLGASAQAVYNWEQTDVRPRQEYIDKIALLRRLSKPQVQALLEQHAVPKPRKNAAAKKTAKKPSAGAKAATARKPAKP